LSELQPQTGAQALPAAGVERWLGDARMGQRDRILDARGLLEKLGDWRLADRETGVRLRGPDSDSTEARRQ